MSAPIPVPAAFPAPEPPDDRAVPRRSTRARVLGALRARLVAGPLVGAILALAVVAWFGFEATCYRPVGPKHIHRRDMAGQLYCERWDVTPPAVRPIDAGTAPAGEGVVEGR